MYILYILLVYISIYALWFLLVVLIGLELEIKDVKYTHIHIYRMYVCIYVMWLKRRDELIQAPYE